MIASLNEICALTSKTNVARKNMVVSYLSETHRLPCPKLNMKECDQRYLNISYHFEILIPCSTIYFLGIRAQLLQKISHRTFFYRYKKLHGLKLLRGAASYFFTESSYQRLFQILKKVKKLLFLTVDQNNYCFIIFERSYSLLQNTSWEWVHENFLQKFKLFRNYYFQIY